ncbi:response regulator transcription factor [Paenibacillus thalictri]|uniref:Response regulator n=1 Tax=Paenibacillus thalictri TaxID=2527873 RepID=A0A4Q9DME4_9BACL|nr:response regulator [Paenibacillus thalictri]TBL75788.1 response regulator [Paenibacillus thalictri]
MNVLIVDDEAHVREAIDLSVDWEKFGVIGRYMAENGIQALESLKLYKPAVMFCDMKMPVMNGIELLKKIREEGLDTHVIVISGYDDFEYTRATIQANGVDYILKPFRSKDVEDALHKAVQAWKEQTETRQTDAEREYVVRKADALLDEKKLAAYFRGEMPLSPSVRKIVEKNGLPDQRLHIALILPKNRMKVLDQRFMLDEELFTFAVRNIAQYTFGSHFPHYLCRLDDYQWLLVFKSQVGTGDAGGTFYLERLKRAMMQTIQLDVLIGRSGECAHLQTIHGIIAEARNALLNGDILSGSAAAAANVQEDLPALLNQQFLLKQAIETGNKTFAADILGKHANALRRRGKLLLKELQVCTMEANLLLGRWKQLAGVGGDAQVPFLPLWINDLDEWEQMLIQQVHLLIDGMNPNITSGHGIEEVKDYLDKHYHEDVSLPALSEQFHFSTQYISKKFKETYGITVVAYLTDLRMDKAKALLKSTALSIADIAGQLGYDDENYFSKVFKKQVGMSPFPYRKLHEIK